MCTAYSLCKRLRREYKDFLAGRSDTGQYPGGFEDVKTRTEDLYEAGELTLWMEPYTSRTFRFLKQMQRPIIHGIRS